MIDNRVIKQLLLDISDGFTVNTYNEVQSFSGDVNELSVRAKEEISKMYSKWIGPMYKEITGQYIPNIFAVL